jgi:putative nucleotidyltransferase with HDIG domain
MDPAGTSLPQITLLLDALNCGAAVLDPAQKILAANARLCRMTQCAAGDLVGRPIQSLFPTATDQSKLRTMLGGDDDGEVDLLMGLPDGQTLRVVCSSRRVPADPLLGDHRIITLIDVSRHTDAEHTMREHYRFIVEMSDTVIQQAVELKRYSQTLEERVRQRTAELHEAHMEAIYMLAVASEAKDLDTGRHVRRIERYSRLLATELGMSAGDAETIGYSAILHDIGKIHVPDRILSKPGPLDAEERKLMEQHTIAGERILSRAAFFERARRIARSHHENWDGSGYPDQLAGNAIPLEARIVHVADVFDALTTARAYKDSWSVAQAADAIVREGSRMFDPQVVQSFQSLITTGQFETNGDRS